jgi:hypothetical protein
MNDPEQPFPQLVQAELEGTATPEQRARLAGLIRTNAALRAEYVRQMRLDALLHFTGGTRASGKSAAPEVATPRGFRFSRFSVLSAAAAIIVLGLSALWWERRGVEVEVVRVAGAAADHWRAGTTLRVGRLTLPHGQLELRLASGVRLDVFAPADVRFVDAMQVRVSLGQVTADVGDRGKGFIVTTAQTEIVDLGTKFGVAVSEPGHTDVVVFEGEVELFDRISGRRADAPLTRLVEGEAVRVDARQQMSRIMSVTSGPRDEDWTTGDGSGTVVAAVHDNLRDASARYYYRILAGGMREDALAFVAKRHEWNGLDASGIPAELLGADLVQTFGSDRLNADLEITVTVSRPAIVYVLADSRATPPAWLKQDFVNTGASLGLENAPLLSSGRPVGRGPGIGNMAPFAVWKRALPEGGSIKLGPPGLADEENRQWMYGIAAKPL